MVVSDKKRQVSRHGVRIRLSRPSAPLFARRSPVRNGLSEDALRLLVRGFAVLLLACLTFSLVLGWQVRRENAKAEHLAQVHADIKARHDRLHARREALLAKSRIAKAAARLGLYPPGKDQEHRLD